MEKYTNVDKFLIINQKIILDVKFGEYPGVFDSRIEDIRNKSIYITMPSEKGFPVPLAVGVSVNVSYVGDGGRFSFQSKVISRLKEQIPMLEIEKPSVVFRKELREFFRINTRAKVKILNSYEDDKGSPVDDVFEAYVQDISGGGMRVTAGYRLEYGREVEIYFGDMVPDLKSARAVVMRSVAHEDQRYEAGLKFLGMNTVDRDKVIKYVFKRQLELRKLIG
ncbi:MAG: flagellar brake protein [Deferribacterales bacterium]